AG
ncbi:hypothetical protein CLOM_g7825, partial [Closterium sp. NIES-68]